jgi:Mce-associated membrane protein
LRRQLAAADAPPSPPNDELTQAAAQGAADAPPPITTDNTACADITETASATTTTAAGGQSTTDPLTTTPTAIRRRPRIPRPSLRPAIVTVALISICGLLVLSGFFIWHHHQARTRDQRITEFAAAARQGVVALMSLDFNKAPADVQRIIDGSTGTFRQDFEARKDDFIKAAQQSKVITDTTVNAAAVQSMTDDSAVVLMAVTSHVTNADGTKGEPRSWRLSVSLTRDGAHIKMSKVELVP